LVRPDDRAGALGAGLVARSALLLGPAQESACIPMSPQQLLDARAQGSVGPARLFEKAPQLVGPLAVQGFEKDRLGIGLNAIHGSSPIIVLYSMPRLRPNPPRNVGKINRLWERRPDADGQKARRGHRPIGAPQSAGPAQARRRRLFA